MKYNEFETNDKAGMFPHRHSEQGLSLQKEMVTKEDALEAITNIKACIDSAYFSYAVKAIETLEKFIEQQ